MTEAVPNADRNLECAMAAEAVYSYDRYQAFALSPEDYAFSEPRWVVEAAAEAWEVDGTVDLESVSKALQRGDKLSRMGGPEGLARMLSAPAVADPERLVELRRLRAVREAALRVAVAAERGDLTAALSALGEAQAGAIDAGRSQAIDGFDLGVQLLERLTQGRHGAALVHPGYDMLEQACGQLPLGGMTVLGGATNVGKSSVALEILVRAATRTVDGKDVGTPCGYVSCEDPPAVVSSRLLAVYSGLSSRKLITGSIAAEDWSILSAAYGPLEKAKGKMWFAFAVGGSEIDVCAAMSRCAQQGSKLVIVDYVQAIESSKRQQDRRNEVRWLCARLKAHAQRLNVHLVLVSQLGRPTKGDENREPTKHDLKEAGDLENAAEYIVLLWREREDDFAEVNVKLAKSKIGNIGARWQLRRHEGTARLNEVRDSYESAAKRRHEGKQ